MFSEIQEDFYHVCQVDSGGVPKNVLKKLRTVLDCYGFQVLVTFRLFQYIKTSNNGICSLIKLPFLMTLYILHKLLERMYDIHISLDAAIKGGLYIGHFGGIRIGKCTIGRWCNINHQVQIGTMKSNRSTAPVSIGDYVWIGAHSVIENGVTVFNAATIAAGTKVSRDITEGSLVMGPSCRMLMKEYDNTRLLGLPLGIKKMMRSQSSKF